MGDVSGRDLSADSLSFTPSVKGKGTCRSIQQEVLDTAAPFLTLDVDARGRQN